MRVGLLYKIGQALVLIFSLAVFSCGGNREEIPVPPPTNPMIREFIGYGVVNVSFVHVLNEPLQENASLGYLRKRSLVKIIERKSLANRGNVESWVKIDAEYSGSPDGTIQGWLRENTLNIYDNQFQAHTAVESMLP